MRPPIDRVRLILLGVIIATCAPASAGAQEKTQPPKQEVMTEPGTDMMKGINAARAVFGDAYVKQDAKTLSALFHSNAVFAGTLHPYWLEGRDTIQRLWAYYFGTYKNARIYFWSSSFRVLSHSPAVAQHATATMAMPDASGSVRNIHMRLSVIWIRVPDYVVASQTLQWQIAHMHGSEAPLSR